MTIYNDLYIRDSYSDTGVIPSSGNAYQSPDIIPFQNNILDWSVANSTYAGPDIGKKIINNGVNNIYVRCKNLNTNAASGNVDLYYSEASLFLLPKKWTRVMSSGGSGSLSFVDGSGKTSISANGVAISNPSFFMSGLPGNGHYCFIAVIQTKDHPVTIPTTFDSDSKFVQWVQNNPSIGWRNIIHLPNTLTQVSQVLNFGNADQSKTYFIFAISGHGFVPNTKINCQCSHRDCSYIDFEGSFPEPDEYGNQSFNSISYPVPANFDGDLVTTVTSPSGQFPKGAHFSVTFYKVPTSNELDLIVSKRFTLVSGTEEKPFSHDAMLIKIGECTTNLI